ncbi:MAG TPA: APC family permease [Candidatus Dormibacteraeota bacterium]|nr:APC family permease [Candidatus Dormibacteraeota bacterium]
MEQGAGQVLTARSDKPHLQRVLGLWDLIYFGVILTSPIAAVPLFGESQVLSHGHTVSTLLLAMVAMSVTAVSFGRMAFVYPSTGSVYTYVSRGLNPHLGFIVGWAMFLEYLFQPIQNALYAALAIQRMAPKIPFALLAAIAVGFITILTVQGIKFTARTNEILLGFMVLITAAFLVQSFRYIVLHESLAGLFSIKPIYNPATFNLRALAAGTSLAALVFIGFDGVSILAEEVKNPKRNVLLASVLVCVFTGLFSGLQVYLAQRVWPDYTTLENPETAFMDVARMASGPLLFAAYGIMLLVSSVACGLAGHVGAARLLYSMGRDDVLPKKIFGFLDPKRSNPTYNIWIVGVLAYIGTLTIPWERSAEIVTFGALLAFMGVNLAALRHFWFSREAAGQRNFFIDALLPGFGLIFCFLLLISLQTWTKYAGLAWLALGLVYAAYKTRWFRVRPKLFDFSES